MSPSILVGIQNLLIPCSELAAPPKSAPVMIGSVLLSETSDGGRDLKPPEWWRVLAVHQGAGAREGDVEPVGE